MQRSDQPSRRKVLGSIAAASLAAAAPVAAQETRSGDMIYRVMASVGTDDGKSVTSRGWYRVDPGKCVHPDISGQPRRIFSFAEAVDNDGRAIKTNGTSLSWGGSSTLCTRDTQFEINDQSDCAGRGFSATGYTLVDSGAGKT